MALVWPAKDPDEVLDYQLDWSAEMSDGDEIITSTWFIDSVDLVEQSSSNTATTTTIWLTGGVLDTSYALLNRVQTVAGRTLDETVHLRIKSK